MAGGGTSGKVEYPEHITQVHKDWLGFAGSGAGDPISTSMIEVMDGALASNPYSSFSYSDPSSDITAFETEVGEVQTKVNALDEEADYNSIVDNVVAKVDQAGVLKDIDTSAIVTAVRAEATTELAEAVKQAVASVDDSIIEGLVKEFEKRSDYARGRATRRFAGQMSDINAVQGSAFVFGMAMIEAEHVQNVNEFNKQVSSEAFNRNIQYHIELYRARLAQEIEVELREKFSRDTMLQDSVRLTASMLGQNVQFKQALAQLYLEMKRIKFVMEEEYVASSADLEAKEDSWELQVYEYGAAILGAPGGAAKLPDKPSKAGSAIGGALSGTAAGAPLGPAGMIGGAVLGGLAGLLQ